MIIKKNNKPIKPCPVHGYQNMLLIDHKKSDGTLTHVYVCTGCPRKQGGFFRFICKPGKNDVLEDDWYGDRAYIIEIFCLDKD